MSPDALTSAARAVGIRMSLLSDVATGELIGKLKAPRTRTELILLFEEPPLAARFDLASDIVHLLGHLPQVVFYVVCRDGLVAFNDHDVLIATGTAERIIDDPQES